ncbi:Hypothetical predicted protein [Mytilus galloprovincialis]|uniref:Uncharacterized protein n=1 Tax=Mytilus galloprovincialis TaxID=29158 RepID=A0A8B6F854_MYTGA|nr:Hypothetical predicted protein [Mytilus galloprovincialis]
MFKDANERKYRKAMNQKTLQTVKQKEPEVINESVTSCTGISPRTTKSNIRPKYWSKDRVRNYEVIHYADEMYDDNFVPLQAENELEAPSRTRRSSVDDSAKYNNKQFDRIGRLHKLQSTASQSKSKVSFDTTSMTFQLNSSCEHRSRKSKRESSTRVTKRHTQAERRRDKNRSSDSNKKGNEHIQNSNNSVTEKFYQIRQINDYPKENLRKLTPAPLYPRDNYIAPVTADNGEEIDSIVQNVIRQRYSHDSLQEKTNVTVNKKLWSSNNNTYRSQLDTELMDNTKRSQLDTDLMDKTYETKTQIRTAQAIEMKKTTKNCDSKTDEQNNAHIDTKHLRSDQFENGLDVYVVMKRKQFAEKEKTRSLNTDILKSLNPVKEEDVPVESASDDDNLSVKASYAQDDNLGSDFYLTATILGEENRDEPDTVVVVTGRVQGLQVREYPREPLGRTKRTYFDVSDDEKIVLKDEIPQPKYHKRKLKPKVENITNAVCVGECVFQYHNLSPQKCS